MTDVLTQLCSELADLTARNAVTESAFRALSDMHDACRDDLAAETERNARLDRQLDEYIDRTVELCELLGVSDPEALPDRAEAYVDAVDGAYEKISAGAEKSGDPEKLGDRIDKALDKAYDRDGAYQRASDALRRYLIRQGLPADPVRLDDPDLWALYEALSDS